MENPFEAAKRKLKLAKDGYVYVWVFENIANVVDKASEESLISALGYGGEIWRPGVKDEEKTLEFAKNIMGTIAGETLREIEAENFLDLCAAIWAEMSRRSE